MVSVVWYAVWALLGGMAAMSFILGTKAGG